MHKSYEPLIQKEYHVENESTEIGSDSNEIAPKLEPKKGVKKFMLHLRLLLYKNVRLFWRNKKITLFQLLTPILSIFVMWVLQTIFSDLQSLIDPTPEINQLGNLPLCKGKDCVTLGYFIIGDSPNATDEEYDWIHHTMKHAAAKNGLEFGQDVKQLLITPTAVDIEGYLYANENKTWYGAVFCTTEWNGGNTTNNVTIPCVADNRDPNRADIDVKFYSILYNFTLLPSYFLAEITAPAPPDPNLLIVKNSIDNGIYDYLLNSTEPLNDRDSQINITWSSYPISTLRIFNDADISSLVASFYIALGPIVTFVVLLTEVVREKELKLRQGLSVVGLSHGSYWLHWLITGMFFSSVVSLMSIIMGLITQFNLFYNANFFILFSTLFMFTMTMIGYAFVFATICSSQRVAYTVSYAWVLFCIVILLVVSNPLTMYFIFFNDISNSFIILIRYIFYMLPPFTFSLIFGIIVRKATSHFDDNAQQFIKGTGFGWADLVQPEKGEFSTGDTYSSPTPLAGFGILCLQLIMCGILIWYFDHVVSSNRGSNERFYFFATRNYWENL
jgi:hypothetical protein